MWSNGGLQSEAHCRRSAGAFQNVIIPLSASQRSIQVRRGQRPTQEIHIAESFAAAFLCAEGTCHDHRFYWLFSEDDHEEPCVTWVRDIPASIGIGMPWKVPGYHGLCVEELGQSRSTLEHTRE